jgi:hypothetical protein
LADDLLGSFWYLAGFLALIQLHWRLPFNALMGARRVVILVDIGQAQSDQLIVNAFWRP